MTDKVMMFKSELNELFKGNSEEAIFRDDKDGMDERLIYIKGFKYNKNIICYIDCEFYLDNDDDVKKVHLHSEYNYGGSKQFNDLLEKYGYELEWDDGCMAYIYEDDDA